MTVKLLTQWGDYPPGALYTATAETEAAMIADKVATATLTGGTTWPPALQPQRVPVLSTINAETGAHELSANGDPVPALTLTPSGLTKGGVALTAGEIQSLQVGAGLVISTDAPSDSDGRPDGTIYIQVGA